MIFVTPGQKKGWAIIAMDLVLVLLVYFLFTQLRVNEQQIERRQDGITYRLTVKPVEKHEVPLRFTIESRRSSPVELSLPKGITLMISDHQENVYWRETIQRSTTIEIPAGQSRQWSHTASLPESSEPPYLAGFFIDSERQGMTNIPE